MRGFDDYVNMVLDDVTEYEIDADGTKRKVHLDQVGGCVRVLAVRQATALELPRASRDQNVWHVLFCFFFVGWLYLYVRA